MRVEAMRLSVLKASGRNLARGCAVLIATGAVAGCSSQVARFSDAVDGISSWRDLMAVAAQVRGYLGVSPSAYEDACHVMGPETAALVVACILQRAQHINSAGGYLRALTEKAREGQFSVGPMLMAALKANSTAPDRRAG